MIDDEPVSLDRDQIASAPPDISPVTRKATPQLDAAVARAQASIESITKDGFNAFAKYKYATCDAVIAECRRALSAQGVRFSRLRQRPARIDSQLFLEVFFVAAHESGEFEIIETWYPVDTSTKNPLNKSINAALTQAKAWTIADYVASDRSEEDPELIDIPAEDKQDSKHKSKPPTKSTQQKQAPQTVAVTNTFDRQAAAKARITACIEVIGLERAKAAIKTMAGKTADQLEADAAVLEGLVAKSQAPKTEAPSNGHSALPPEALKRLDEIEAKLAACRLVDGPDEASAMMKPIREQCVDDLTTRNAIGEAEQMLLDLMLEAKEGASA